MNELDLLTADEIARLLKVSTQLIYNLSSLKLPVSQRLPSLKIGRLRRFKYEEVLQYFEDRNFENQDPH